MLNEWMIPSACSIVSPSGHALVHSVKLLMDD